MLASHRPASSQLCLRSEVSSWVQPSLGERTGQPFRRIRSEVLLELHLAATLLVLEEVERERLPCRTRDDLEVERGERLVRRLRRALGRIDVRGIAVIVHAEVTDV